MATRHGGVETRLKPRPSGRAGEKSGLTLALPFCCNHRRDFPNPPSMTKTLETRRECSAGLAVQALWLLAPRNYP